MTSKDPVEELKTFLESKPPNIPVLIPGLAIEHSPGFSVTLWTVEKVAPKRLELHCAVDDGVRRFDASEKNTPGRGFQFLEYVCRDCGESKKTYALVTELKSVGGGKVAAVMKLGEYPPFGAPISARIQKLLGKGDLELYRKGRAQKRKGLESVRQRTFAASLRAIGSSL